MASAKGATKAPKKGAPKRRPAKDKANASTLSMGSTDANPDQPQLEGFEEDRIVEIESIVSSIVNNKARIKELQEQNKELTDDLSEKMHEHNLSSYRCAGRVVTIIEGEETVQIKKAKASKSE